MADPATCLPITPDSIRQTHERIKPHIHRTPLLTCRSLNAIASHPNPRSFLSNDPPSVWEPPNEPSTSIPKFSLYFKMESTQRIGAFKARGAFSAITHLATLPDKPNGSIGLPELRRRGVITHSSGNHAQALALAASTLKVPATIVMPGISTKSKISGTKNTPGVRVVFSGSTSVEREEMVDKVIEEGKKANSDGLGPILVPPYDHPDIMLGQGTTGLEMEQQYQAMKRSTRKACSFAVDIDTSENANHHHHHHHHHDEPTDHFDAVIAPLGGGGLLSGVATWFSHTRNSNSNDSKPTLIFGAEPSFQGANDGERGLLTTPPTRIPHVSTLTIADGLRTPLGHLTWPVISDPSKVQAVYSVSELEIKMALKLVLERMKVVVEPSAAVPLAVLLFNRRFREWVAERQAAEGGDRAWDVGVVISGGNTTVEALSGLFGEGWMSGGEVEANGEDGDKDFEKERAVGVVGRDGERVAEDIAG